MSNFFLFFTHVRLNKALLLLGSVTASLTGIILQNKGLLPLESVTFLFFSFVLLLFALYRSGWMFLLFIGVLPLETVNVAPEIFGDSMLRPYQWLAATLLCAVALRLALKKLPFAFFRPHLFDIFPVFIVIGGFAAWLGAPAPGVALKQALVVTSFVAVYFLGRIFFRTLYDVRQAVSFFLASSVVVFGYAIWQNVMSLYGKESFQVMTGRPNATFSEADWLGLFAVLALGVGLTLLSRLFFVSSEKTTGNGAVFIWKLNFQILLVGLYMTLVFIVLILSVARSAWLGTLALIAVFFLGLFFSQGIRKIRRALKKTLSFGVVIGMSFVLAIALVAVLHLSPFQFFNRIQSTGSGLQKITVACDRELSLPDTLATTDELAVLGCRHINLEEVETEKVSGKFVKEVYRNDPNIVIRKEIYGTVWKLIREHPLTGIGWGNAAFFLGNDERGTGLNASNIFFEVWLGSGLLGVVAFIFLSIGIVLAAGFWFWQTTEDGERLFAIFLLATFAGMMVFNLFNSGILLGFFFIFLSLGALAVERQEIRLGKHWFQKDSL